MDDLEARADAEVRYFTRTPLQDFRTASYAPPDYVLQGLLPRGYVTLLGGHGGMGKSVLAATWTAHVASGRPWAGLPTAKLRSAFVSLEDTGELVRLRLRNVARAYDLPDAAIEGGILLLDGTSRDGTLACEVNDHGDRLLVATAAMEEMRAEVAGCGLIVIDNASDAYCANENDRRQVRTFMRMLSGLARENDSAVLLLAHIDKAAARHGGGSNHFSGSTAWHNSARSRLALIDSDQGPTLVHEKNNLGKLNDPIFVRFDDHGVLMPVRAAAAAGNDDDLQVTLDTLTKAIAAGLTVSTSMSGTLTSYHGLEPVLPSSYRKADGKRRIHAALLRLQEQGRIVRTPYTNANRKQRERWSLAQTNLDSSP